MHFVGLVSWISNDQLITSSIALSLNVCKFLRLTVKDQVIITMVTSCWYSKKQNIFKNMAQFLITN
jgi:hypothetical protein